MYFDYNRDYNSADNQIDITKYNELIENMYNSFFQYYWLEITQKDWLKAWNSLTMEEIPNIGLVDFLKIFNKKKRG